MKKDCIKKLGVILKPTDNEFEEKSVLNPSCWQDEKYVHLFYRAIDEKNKSSIGYARLKGPTKVVKRLKKPIIRRTLKCESKGTEDPRIVKIGKTFYITYVAHDGKNATTVLATSKDLKKFKKKGIITAKITYKQVKNIFDKIKIKKKYLYFADFYEKEGGENVLLWGKDVMFFPKKINGQFALLHRVLPGIQIAFFDRLKDLNKNFWINHLKKLPSHTILENKYWFESSHIGGGCPPIETSQGWLIIFHATEKNTKTYHASAALLDKKNPLKVIGRLKKPLFSPTEKWEKQGLVPNVVFPTGAAIFNKTLYIYYGAADQRIAVASIKIEELLKKLKYGKR